MLRRRRRTFFLGSDRRDRVGRRRFLERVGLAGRAAIAAGSIGSFDLIWSAELLVGIGRCGHGGYLWRAVAAIIEPAGLRAANARPPGIALMSQVAAGPGGAG
ncbi:MAG: hypothetical protein H0U52_10745 [Chloroflexi bacterium]|nr:hypothetical protein [Chloroflexota bacterium]